MITVDDYMMGRTAGLTQAMHSNAGRIVVRANVVVARYQEDCPDAPRVFVRSGRRYPEGNAAVGGAQNSTHLTCEGIDLADAMAWRSTRRPLARWLLAHLDVLEELDLYMEDPRCTGGDSPWVHLQTRRTSMRVFIPNVDWARRLAKDVLDPSDLER